MGDKGAPLRILHVIGRISERFGGPQRYLREISSILAARGHTVVVIGSDAGDRGLTADGAAFSDKTECIVVPGFGGFAFSPQFPLRVRRALSAADILHVHGLYTFPASAAARMARAQRVPYVISPHGAATDYHHITRRWKKAPYERLVQAPELRHAGAVVTLSEQERVQAQANLRVSTKVVVARPPVDIPSRPTNIELDRFYDDFPELRGKRLVTFMARLSEKKGAPIAVDAFMAAAGDMPDTHLVIAGPDDEGGLGAALRRNLVATPAASRVSFLGMVSGARKRALLGASSLFILPSADESFGLAVAEAMAAGVAVLVTPHVALATEIEASGAGVVSARRVDELGKAMRGMLTHEALPQMGVRGRDLIARDYSDEAAGGGLEDAYNQVLDPPPDGRGAVDAGA